MAERLLKGPFTVDDYHRLAELGILDEDDRVELLDGQVVEMTPIGPEHAGCVDALTTLLSRRVGDAAVVRVQNPLILGTRWEPQPDVALLRPRADGYRTAHPGAGATFPPLCAPPAPCCSSRPHSAPHRSTHRPRRPTSRCTTGRRRTWNTSSRPASSRTRRR